jgi:hypothetical protein
MYGYKKETKLTFQAAVDKVKESFRRKVLVY